MIDYSIYIFVSPARRTPGWQKPVWRGHHHLNIYDHDHDQHDADQIQVDEDAEEKGDFSAAAADFPIVPEMGAMGLIG